MRLKGGLRAGKIKYLNFCEIISQFLKFDILSWVGLKINPTIKSVTLQMPFSRQKIHLAATIFCFVLILRTQITIDMWNKVDNITTNNNISERASERRRREKNSRTRQRGKN